MLVYFAAPLFCQAERAFNLQLTRLLEQRGFSVFLPQRDGVELCRPPYDTMTAEEQSRAIFAVDRDKVIDADVLLFVLDGRVPDEGACVELGIAYSQKHLAQQDKLLIGLLTDERGTFAFPEAKLNAMIYGALDCVKENESDLITAIEAYRREREDNRAS